MALLAPRFQAVFHHYPRTGGSSVRQALGGTTSFPEAHASTKTYDDALKAPGVRWAHFVKLCSELWYHFGIVRNPYDLVVSLCRNANKLEFPEFVRAAFVDRSITPDRMAGYEFISQCEHYQVGRHAQDPAYPHAGYAGVSLFDFGDQDSLTQLQARLGLGEVGHIGASKRHADWRTYYDKDTADIVTRVFEADLEHFEYERFIP